jgi:hypothetical protein
VRFVNGSLPDFVIGWPSIFIHDEPEGDGRIVELYISDAIPGLSQITVAVDCGKTDCVHSIGPYSRIINFESSNRKGFTYVVRSMPGFLPTGFCFNFSTKREIRVTICFTWDAWSAELKSFIDELPSFVLPLGKVRALGDTTLIIEKTI